MLQGFECGSAIDKLSVIWKSDMTDKMKCSFFQAAIVSILLYGCTSWTLTKWQEKRLDGQLHKNSASNIEQFLEAAPHIATAVRPPYHLSQKLSKLDETDMQDTAGEVGTSSLVMCSYGPYIWPSKSRAISSNLLTAAL